MGRASLGSVVVVIGIEIKDPEEVAAGLEQPVDRIDLLVRTIVDAEAFADGMKQRPETISSARA